MTPSKSPPPAPVPQNTPKALRPRLAPYGGH